MQHVADRVVESGHAYVVRNPDPGLLQGLVRAGRSLVGAGKKSRRPFATGKQRLNAEVTEFTVFRVDFFKFRFEPGFLHGLFVALGASREPRQPQVAYIKDSGVALRDEVT